jgi:competence protein ComEC
MRKILLTCLLFLAGCAAPFNDLPAGSELVVYFIDVGQADSALVLCDGRAMLIDGGNTGDSVRIEGFLRQHRVTRLDYIVGTHGHEDHIGGLSGVLRHVTAGTVYCPVADFDSKAFGDFVLALADQGAAITVPQAGEVFFLGSASVHLLAPQRDYDEPNDTSIVLKIVYGETSFLFTGDAGRAAEADILAAGYDLRSTVLKVGHHGSETSTTYPFLREIMPQYAVISVGKDNAYGHPDENTLSRLRDADVIPLRTDLQGTVTCTSDGESVSVRVEKHADIQTDPALQAGERRTADEASAYIGNLRSRKFHLPSCRSLPAEDNRIWFATREGALHAGYNPCSLCKP